MTSKADHRGAHPARILSVAPMMDYSDRHFRWILRQLTRHTLLYTEMVTTGALLCGDTDRFLAFDPLEKPLALQLGGDDPDELARCAEQAAARGYDEVNLNVGCPSDRVQKGRFGACLMARPELVGRCVAAMQRAVSLPITVKHRVGIDGLERYEDLRDFVRIVSDHGCRVFIVHARIAVLGGLSPKQNRVVPPLRYDDVHRLAVEHPELEIEINGGISDLDAAAVQLRHVDGVMIGRGAIDTPYLFADADRRFFDAAEAGKSVTGKSAMGPTRRQVVERVLPYLREHIAAGGSPHHVLRHLLGLLAFRRGTRLWRRAIGGSVGQAADPVGALEALLERMDPTVLDEAAAPVASHERVADAATPSCGCGHAGARPDSNVSE